MAEGLHPLAPHNLPFFAPAVDGADRLTTTVGIILLVSVLAIGVIFFWIHSLPERMAHRTQKVQMELVAVLCLLALLTHIHAFWVAGLILALVDFPKLTSPVNRIAVSLERIAERAEPTPVMAADPPQIDPSEPQSPDPEQTSPEKA
jgi:hypothetical protein